MSKHEQIKLKLQSALSPTHIDVVDESHMHSAGKGAESHFKVVVVSDRFEGLTPVKRHQLIYGALAEEMSKKPSAGGIHALAITSRTCAEWAASPVANDSPKCAGKGT